MQNLEEANAGDVLRIVDIEDKALEDNLGRIGLKPGSKFVKFPKEEVERRSVRVHGPTGDAVFGGGMSAKIVVRRSDGSKTSLAQMNLNESGTIDSLAGGPGLLNTLDTLGFAVGDEIRLTRKLPPMEYVALVDKKKHVHLLEGIASKIWGVTEGRNKQFTSAKVLKEFKVTKLLGGHRAQGYLAGLDIKPGTLLFLVGIEQGKQISYGPGDHLAIETLDGLRIFLGPDEAGAMIVEAVD